VIPLLRGGGLRFVTPNRTVVAADEDGYMNFGEVTY
jgi:hypothetical protein